MILVIAVFNALLIVTAFWLGYRYGYYTLRKAFKLGIQDHLSEKNPEELEAFKEAIDEEIAGRSTKTI